MSEEGDADPITKKMAPANIRRAQVVAAANDLKIDRYGMLITSEDEQISAKEKKLIQQENELEEKNALKWNEVIRELSTNQKINSKKLQELILMGIPDSIRVEAWRALIDPSSLKPKDPKNPTAIEKSTEEVDELIKKGSNDGWQIIEADLARTMPRCPMFNDEKIIESMRRILYAYSNKDKQLQYTQGMSFFAGFLLFYMDEDTAFRCFVQLMEGPKFEWRNYFLPDFPRLRELNKVWMTAIKDQYPKVYKNIVKIDLDPLIYTPSWFLTAFMCVDFPTVVKLRVLDAFFGYGSRALLSFGLAIISRHKKELATSRVDVALSILQRPHVTPNTKDWRYLLKKFHDKFIPEKKYISYFKKAGVDLFP